MTDAWSVCRPVLIYHSWIECLRLVVLVLGCSRIIAEGGSTLIAPLSDWLTSMGYLTLGRYHRQSGWHDMQKVRELAKDFRRLAMFLFSNELISGFVFVNLRK